MPVGRTPRSARHSRRRRARDLIDCDSRCRMGAARPKGPATCDFTFRSATKPAVAGRNPRFCPRSGAARPRPRHSWGTYVRAERPNVPQAADHAIVRGDRRFPPSGSSGRESGDRHVTGSLQKSRTLVDRIVTRWRPDGPGAPSARRVHRSHRLQRPVRLGLLDTFTLGGN